MMDKMGEIAPKNNGIQMMQDYFYFRVQVHFVVWLAEGHEHVCAVK